jgi:phosphatidylserine decarboxylase
MVMVLVGAINVSATETVWHGLVTSAGGKIKRFNYTPGEVSLKRGDEMGRFNLGSTVILITTENFRLDERIEADAAVYMGGNIGRTTEL